MMKEILEKLHNKYHNLQKSVSNKNIILLLNSLEVFEFLEHTLRSHINKKQINNEVASFILLGRQILGANLEQLSRTFTNTHTLLSEICFSSVKGSKPKSWFGHDRFAIAHASEPNQLFNDKVSLVTQTYELLTSLKPAIIETIGKTQLFNEKELDSLLIPSWNITLNNNVNPILPHFNLPEKNLSKEAYKLAKLLYLIHLNKQSISNLAEPQLFQSFNAYSYGLILIEMIGNNIKSLQETYPNISAASWPSFIDKRNKIAHSRSFHDLFTDDEIYKLLSESIKNLEAEIIDIINLYYKEKIITIDDLQKALNIIPQKKQPCTENQEIEHEIFIPSSKSKTKPKQTSNQEENFLTESTNGLTPATIEEVKAMCAKLPLHIRILKSITAILINDPQLLFLSSINQINLNQPLKWHLCGATYYEPCNKYYLRYKLSKTIALDEYYEIYFPLPASEPIKKTVIISFLELAWIKKNIEAFELLIVLGANCNIIFQRSTKSPLISIIASNKIDEQKRENLIELILSNNTNLNIINNRGETPLLASIYFNRKTILSKLIQYGGKADTKFPGYLSAFEAVTYCFDKYKDFFHLLIKEYASINKFSYISNSLQFYKQPPQNLTFDPKVENHIKQIIKICEDDSLILHQLVLTGNKNKIKLCLQNSSSQDIVQLLRTKVNHQNSYSPIALAKAIGQDEICAYLTELAKHHLNNIIHPSNNVIHLSNNVIHLSNNTPTPYKAHSLTYERA